MGGLFTALALRDRGHDAWVHEQSTAELTSRGAGIVVQPVIERFLDRHTAGDADQIATRSTERRYLDADGRVRRSVSESMTFTSWDALFELLREAMPDDRYRTGDRAVSVIPDSGTLTLADRTERRADLVVAADGGQSTIRQQLFPDVEPDVADYVAWRGTVPESDLPSEVVAAFDRRLTFLQGSDSLILGYFIPGADGGTDAGERRLNWVWYDGFEAAERSAVFTGRDGTDFEVTVPPGRVRESVLDAQRSRATALLPPVFERIVEVTAQPFVQAIYDLAVPSMTTGRVCLLGDAAFVARPHTAAGTAKAAGDAVALADALADHDTLSAAIATWDTARTAYGEQLVARGREMGEERLHIGE